MQIILDANVYATDYRMKGVSFRTLFEYLRRTDSRIVLPRSIREEVILSYGRRLKAEAKEFAEVWNRYRYLELDYDRGLFDKPDVGDAQKALRRILRKPFGGIPTIFVAQMEGVSVEEVFIRGARGKRPANEQGEELRDVIIWLWVLSYSDTAGTQVAFISATQVSGLKMLLTRTSSMICRVRAAEFLFIKRLTILLRVMLPHPRQSRRNGLKSIFRFFRFKQSSRNFFKKSLRTWRRNYGPSSEI